MRPPPSHAITADQLETFKTQCATWQLEDGFPCANHRPRQYFTVPKLTWATLHSRYEYELKQADPNARIVSYSRYIQLAHFHYPGVRLTRTAEDVCDCCVRLDIQILRDDLSEDERDALIRAKAMHLSVAIDQRRFVSAFIKSYLELHAPDQRVPSVILPDVYDAEQIHANEGQAAQRLVQIQAEDFGGGIAMPHYGHERPSADYFNSNLTIHNFVVADITNNRNNVYCYDERTQGKGADALCSLRLLCHLNGVRAHQANGTQIPDVNFSILDDCVRQDKSRVVMMFFGFLSVVFPYKKVVLCFLLPGHSHNIADRVVAWCRGATRKLNVYTPMALVGEVNKVKSVKGVFIDHNDPDRPCFTE